MAVIVGFADERVKKAFDALKTRDIGLYHRISEAMDTLKTDPGAGIKIPSNLWPKKYVKKFDINNLWKYNLPDAWRLIYTLRGDRAEIITIVLEWMDHGDYERRFGYG